jgi:hypothetical protein
MEMFKTAAVLTEAEVYVMVQATTDRLLRSWSL